MVDARVALGEIAQAGAERLHGKSQLRVCLGLPGIGELARPGGGFPVAADLVLDPDLVDGARLEDVEGAGHFADLVGAAAVADGDREIARGQIAHRGDEAADRALEGSDQQERRGKAEGADGQRRGQGDAAGTVLDHFRTALLAAGEFENAVPGLIDARLRLFEQGGFRLPAWPLRSAIRAGIETDLALQAEPIVSMTVWPPLEKAISSMLLSTALSLAATCSALACPGMATKLTSASSRAARWARKSRLSVMICWPSRMEASSLPKVSVASRAT